MSQLVVTSDIPIGDPGRGAYAYRVGQFVDEDDVKANKWDAYVAKPGTKAAQAAADQAAGVTSGTDTEGS